MNQLGCYELEKISETKYVGKTPILSYYDGMSFGYGGNLVAQSLYSAYQLVDNMEPHAIHINFCKPIPIDKPLTYELKILSASKSFTKVLVEAYNADNEIIGVSIISFTNKNNQYEKKLEWSKMPNADHVPYSFEFTPLPEFFKYQQQDIDKFDTISCTRDLFKIALPPGFEIPHYDPNSLAGDRRHGYWMKFNEFNNEEINKITSTDNKIWKMYQYVDLACLSDTNGLALFFRNLNIKFKPSHLAYRMISLDHSIWFHNNDFDLHEWMYCDATIKVYANDRAFIVNTLFNPRGKPFMTLTQECSIRINQKVAEAANGGSYKL